MVGNNYIGYRKKELNIITQKLNLAIFENKTYAKRDNNWLIDLLTF